MVDHDGRGVTLPSPGPGLHRTEFGAVWRIEARDINVGDWGDLVAYPLHEPTLAGYTFPDGARPGRWDHIPALRAQYPDHFLAVGFSGLFEAAWSLCGFENYLSYILSEEDFVRAVTGAAHGVFLCGHRAVARHGGGRHPLRR